MVIKKTVENALLYTLALLSGYLLRYLKKVVSIPNDVIAFKIDDQLYMVVKIPYTPVA